MEKDQITEIKLYGTNWCGDTIRARTLLDNKGVFYTWIDIDRDAEAEKFVKITNRGYRSVPTIIFPDGSILVEPSERELLAKIENKP
jgi:mycoredoxin